MNGDSDTAFLLFTSSVSVNMADKGNKPPPIAVGKPVPMKLFATWEVDRTPHNCIPRYE